MTSSPSPKSRKVNSGAGRRSAPHRQYADVKNERSKASSSEDFEWPGSPSATALPTPYEIFKQRKGTPYSKRRFYELVKIYHPDRNSHSESSSSLGCLSHAVRLERYRLIVAANEILSDPAKRSAYDKYGTGWSGQFGCREPYRWSQATGWSGFDDNASPARNATWEDWEKWYQRDAKGKQEPLHFSNGGLLFLIVFVAILGGMGQFNRVGELSKTFLEQVEAIHDESSKELQRARKETQGFGNKDKRVQNFLKVRDPIGYGITDHHEDGYRKLLPEPEVCMSSDIHGRSKPANQD
ncbi:hypothetical protein MMC14_003564 [Varicellaria rhodocarpa]|nr:hypothetical protein [Varicellaria rhodocarpa]